MNNPLYQQYNSSNPQANSFIQRFNQFRQSFTGNPQQMVQQLMNSGKISQERYNQAVQMANQLMRNMK
jgi:putative ribosome biogenesis GTPase RsgA